MKKISAALFLFISMAVVALPASADTYTLTFQGGTGPAYGGFQVAPYNFLVSENGGTAVPEAMMCIDFAREITQGEVWTANKVSITGPITNPSTPPVSTAELEAMAILDNQMVAATDATDKSNYQYAVWSLSVANPSPSVFNSTALGYANAAVAAVTAGNTSSLYLANVGTFANYVYFDPTSWNGAPNLNVAPQRFLLYAPVGTPFHPNVNPGPVPEPSSLALLGTGVLGLASVARRRFKA